MPFQEGQLYMPNGIDDVLDGLHGLFAVRQSQSEARLWPWHMHE